MTLSDRAENAPPRARWTHWIAAAIVVVALLVRIAVVVATDEYEPLFDAADYTRHAQSISAGDDFPPTQVSADGGPTAFRPPAYPYALALVYTVSGDDETAGRLLGAVFGAAAVLLIYLIALELWGRRTLGLIAAAIAAIFPPLVLSHVALLSEPLFIVFELGVVWALLRLRRSPRPWAWAIPVGVLCAAAALTRSNGILLLLPALLGAWTAGAPRRQALLPPAVVAASALLVMTPWAVRNTASFDRLVITSTQSGYGLAGTYNDAARTDKALPATWVAPQFQGDYKALFRRTDLDEAELDRELRNRALDYAQSHPAYVLKVSGFNALRLVDVFETRSEASLRTGGSPIGNRTVDVARWSTWALLLLAAVGALRLILRPPPGWRPIFVWLVPVLMVLPALLVLAGPRYRLPADPFLALAAAVAVLWISRRAGLLSSRPPAAADR